MHRARRGSPRRDWLRSEGRSARREGRAEGKLPVTSQFRRCGRRKIAANSDGTLNWHQKGCDIKHWHNHRREDMRLRLLRKVGSGGQCPARLVAIARAGSGMRVLLGATILFAEQSRRINQTARHGWQPNERQHQRDRCFDTLHGEENSVHPFVAQYHKSSDGRDAVPDHRVSPAARRAVQPLNGRRCRRIRPACTLRRCACPA